MRENPIFQKIAKLVINDDFAKNRRDKETDKETQFNPARLERQFATSQRNFSRTSRISFSS